MATELFTNEGSTTVSSGGTTAPAAGTVETWTVASSATFPAIGAGQQFHVADPASATTAAEIVAVTAVSGTSWTVTRGAESTTPVAHAAGFTVQNLITAGTLGAFQQAPIDTVAADFQPEGVAAAGASGKLADAKHVHPYQPSSFLPAAYGAKGDGVVVMDGAMTAASAALACATSTPFKSTDVGKPVIVNGAGSATAGNALVTTISAFTDSGHVTLAANAVATVSGAAVLYGTDDTSAFQQAVTAAVAYLGTNWAAEVYIPPPPGGWFYMIAGALQTTGTGNSQILIPSPLNTNPKQTLRIRMGTPGAADSPLWSQTTPQAVNALVSTGLYASPAAYTTNYNTFGDSSVIGGTPSATGLVAQIGGLPAFANMQVIVENVRIVCPSNSQGLHYTAVNLAGVGQAKIKDCSAILTTNYFTSSGANQYPSTGSMTNGRAKAFILPGGGNNDLAYGENLYSSGFGFAFVGSEHAYYSNVRAIANWSAFAVVSNSWSQSASEHIFRVDTASCELNRNIFWVQGAGSVHGFYIDADVDVETTPTLIQDSGAGTGLSSLYGQVRVHGNYNLSMFPTGYPTTVKLIAVGSTVPGWVFGYTGFTTAGSAVAVQNPYWRDARVVVTGGTVTAISAGASSGGTGGSSTAAPTMTATGLTSGTVDWPSGGWLSITYSGAPAVNVCVS